MKVSNLKVYNLPEAMVARGLPFATSFSDNDFFLKVGNLYDYSTIPNKEYREVRLKKTHEYEVCRKLCDAGEPHCNFLTGILVTFNITATQAFFLQAHRYHWWQVVSSQSKMHCLKKFKASESMPLVETSTIENFEELLNNAESNPDAIYDCPMGLETTEHVSTNYQQLRTIYRQRKSHRLQEWKDFCKFIREECPLSKEFITGGE